MSEQTVVETQHSEVPTRTLHPGLRTGNTIVAVYDTHVEAETAVRELQVSGFDMKKLSIVGQGYHTEEDVVGYYNTGDRMKAWGVSGAFWGGVWSMLFGSAFFIIPGIGPLLAAGPLVLWMVSALEGAAVVGGLSALGAALYSVGIPDNSIVDYQMHIKAGQFLVIAHDAQGALDKERILLENTRHHGVKLHTW